MSYYIILLLLPCGRPSGLMACALDSGSSGQGLSPGRGTELCSWAKHFTLTYSGSLHPVQVYHPFQGGVGIFFGLYADFTLTYYYPKEVVNQFIVT